MTAGHAGLPLLLLVLLVGAPRPAGAQSGLHARPTIPQMTPASARTPPLYAPPGASFSTEPAPAGTATGRESVTQRWWFWAAVGGVVAAVVVVVLVAGNEPSPPDSTLGNMDAFRK